MNTLFPSCNHERCCFWWRNGGCSNSIHMKMAPYVALHFPQQQKDLAKMGSFANKVDFAMEKKHSNESSGKKFFCEPILAVRITLETFQCHRWEHNLFSLRLKVWQIDILILNWLLIIYAFQVFQTFYAMVNRKSFTCFHLKSVVFTRALIVTFYLWKVVVELSIARIANAVQVTICLLVSTSVY